MVHAASSSYPLMNVFWTMVMFFAWVIWFWLLITIFGDLFSRHDIGGWGKFGWTCVLLFLPLVGVLIYLIAESGDMAERRLVRQTADQKNFDTYVRSVSTSTGSSSAADIEKAKSLYDDGTITQAEFETLKKKALAG